MKLIDQTLAISDALSDNRDDVASFLESCPVVDAIPMDFIIKEIQNNCGYYSSALSKLRNRWNEEQGDNK